jgi:hypothetical protein
MWSLLSFIGGQAMCAESSKSDTLSVPSFFNSPSVSLDPVDVKIGDAHLRIPRNFLLSANLYNNGGAPGAPGQNISLHLAIATTFPEFIGATAQTINCFERLGSCLSKLVIVHTLGQSEASIKERRAPAIAAAAQIADANRSALVKVDVRVSPVPQDVFVSYGGSIEKSIVVECFRDEIHDEISKRIANCDVYLEFEGVTMLYQFNRMLLPHWREIHDGVTQMLASFDTGKTQ